MSLEEGDEMIADARGKLARDARAAFDAVYPDVT
jgi:hypothetical protein